MARASEALHETRERPLRAVHALNRALLLSDAGDPEAALGVLQVARDEVGDWPLLAPLEDQLLAQEALLRAAVGERELGRALLERAEREPRRRSRSPTPWPGCACWRATRAPRATFSPRTSRNGGGARRPRARRCRSTPRRGCSTRWRSTRSPSTTDAAASLERSLDLAEPAGLSRLIVEHGNVVRPLLHRHVRHGTAHPAIVGEALATLEHRGGERSRPVAVLLAEPLSEREQAILRYLPTMMSNHEIAGELFVSVNTVKTHLKAIYRKLDASGRREAVQRGRELGLMP